MAIFAARPAENADPWYAAREAYDQSLEDAIDSSVALTGDQTITGAKTFMGTNPEPVFATSIAPPLSEWALVGSATFDSGTGRISIPANTGSAMTATIPAEADTMYRISLTRVSGWSRLYVDGVYQGDLNLNPVWYVTASGASMDVRIEIATVSGTLTVTSVAVQAATPPQPAIIASTADVRAWGTNVALGANAQRINFVGANNAAIGSDAQYSLTAGQDNAAFGYAAQRSLTTGRNNAAIGSEAQHDLTTGDNNSAIGSEAQYSLTTGLNNAAIGYAAQRSLTTGNNNSAIGGSVQYSLTTGASNVAIGDAPQYALTTGNDNVAVGSAAQYIPAGSGYSARTITASRQTSIGSETGQSSAVQVDDITTIGYGATAGAVKATSIGSGARADHDGSVALGSDTVTSANNQVMVGGRDIEITDATRGIILESPDGTRYRMTVANGGTLTVTAA